MAEMIYAGDFATESEKRAAAILAKLPDDWIVICNKILATQRRTWEIDFIIIGQRLVFMLDEKSWDDNIIGTDQVWNFPNGYSPRSPLNKVDFVARPLAGHLRARNSSLPGYLVHAGVLLTAAQQLPNINDPRLHDQVFLGSNVNARLVTLDGQQRSSIGEQNRRSIRTCLYNLGNRPATPSHINDCQIIDTSYGPTGIKVFQATLKGAPRTLMVYDMTKSGDRAEDLAFYEREFKALHDLRATQVVAEIKDPFIWSDDFWVLPIVPPDGKTLAAIPMPESSSELYDELLRARTCFEALHSIHSKNVIHRALTPSALVIQGSGNGQKAIFTNFYAARIEEQSIAAQLDFLALTDPYAHPNLAVSYGQANRATDQYSLALIFLERISRRSVTDLRRDTHALPNLYARWSSAPQKVIEELTDLFSSLLNADPEKPRDARTVGGIFGDLAARLKSNDQPPEQILDQRYKVQRLLGKGATAQTYLVTDVHFPNLGSFAIKQYRDAADVLAYAQNEFNTLKDVNTKYLPKIFDISPAEKQAHVKMEYIPGQTLEELQSEFPWPLDRWWKLADHLLSALYELEEHRLLHRDVKPANIIFDTERDRFVLIDFGFSLAVTQDSPPAGTPLYWPPEAPTAAASQSSYDRYALAIVLFRALTGVLPFVGSDKRQLEAPLLTDQRTQRLAKVLLDALSPDPAERPQTAEIFRHQISAALRTIEVPFETIAQLQPRINPWVDSVRGLMRTSASGNSDNRGLDTEFVRNTYVPTALDTRLLPAILQHHPKIVFLSGNPGDGKTAFLEQVRMWLLEQGAQEIVRDPSGWEYLLDGYTYRSCYDASESHERLSADEQLSAKLAGLEGKHLPELALTVLVAINDGRLADFLERHAGSFGSIKQQVEKTRAQGTSAEHPVWLIDLKQRAFVALKPANASTIARRVLDTLVDSTHWVICETCSAKMSCPLTANAHALRQEQVAERLEQLLLLAHLRRQRHITMRDLRSTLALLITGNQSCADIHAAHEQGQLADAFRSLPFWQAVFTTTDGSDELLGDLAMLDPARQPQPGLDRFFHYHQDSQDTTRRQLFFDAQDLDWAHFVSEREWIGALKRRLYFMSHNEAMPTGAAPTVRPERLLPYRHAESYIAILSGTANEPLLRGRIARGLLRSDGLPLSGSDEKLSLRVAYSEQQQLAVVKQFPLDQFVLKVPQPQSGTLVESIPELVIFQHISGMPRIELPLELFELLMRLAEGADPQSEEYKPLLEELVPFKSALLLREANELILIEAQRRIYTIAQQDNQIVLSTHRRQGNES
jgi:serine/threonine protein kinase